MHIEVVPKLDTDSCQCNYEIQCAKRQTKCNNQWQREKLCWSWKRVCRVRCGMEKKRNRITSISTRNQMEVQPIRSTSLWRSMGTADEKLLEIKVYIFEEQISHRGRSFNYDVYCWAEVERKIVDSSQFKCLWLWSIDNQSFLAWQQERLLTLTNLFRKNCWSFDRLKPMHISYGTDFIENICQLWIIGKNGDLQQTKPLKKAISFGCSKTVINVGDNLCRVTETIDGSDGVTRSAIVQTIDGVYKRPIVKLAPILPGKDVFAIKNRAGDVAAELTN